MTMTLTPPRDDKIEQLWRWFADVSTELAGKYEDDEMLDELDRRVAAIGDVSWELGPGSTKECALTLTPDGDPNLLPVTQRAVAMAPELPLWEFYSARQKKEWELQFSMESSGGNMVDVDARPWRYTLLRLPEGRFDIIVEQPNLGDLIEEDRFAAAVIVLDGILGEARRLLSIDGIEAVTSLEPKYSKGASPMRC
jgi:hypothetical protein